MSEISTSTSLMEAHPPPALRSTTDVSSTEVVHTLFGPSCGACYGDFACHRQHNHGRLYATANAVLFYSQLFGFERKLCFFYEDILEIRKYRTTSIRITTVDSEVYVFKAFHNHDLVVQLLNQLKSTGTMIPPESQQQGYSRPSTPEREVMPPPPSYNVTATPTTNGVDTSHQSIQSEFLSSSILEEKKTTDEVILAQSGDLSEILAAEPENLEQAWQEIKKSGSDFKYVALDAITVGCNLNEFHDLFLADNAVHSKETFQSNVIGDSDLSCSPWTQDGDVQIRTTTFRHPFAKGFRMGASSVLTTTTERLRRFGEFGTCVETSSLILDGPAANCFTVHQQWILEPLPAATGQTSFTVRYETRFTKRTLLKSMITKSIKSETRGWFKRYAEMLESALECKSTRQAAPQTESDQPDESLLSEKRLHLLFGVALLIMLLLLVACVFAMLIYITQIKDTLVSLKAEVMLLRAENANAGLCNE